LRRAKQFSRCRRVACSKQLNCERLRLSELLSHWRLGRCRAWRPPHRFGSNSKWVLLCKHSTDWKYRPVQCQPADEYEDHARSFHDIIYTSG
jgi:hypothetical protein